MSFILTSIVELPVSEIKMENRLRPVSPAGVEGLKASFAELGVMKDPIHVRKLKGSEHFVLIAGGHRLTAAKELGWETIKVTCWQCNNDFAEMMEVDDNLAGSDLSPLDTAVFLAKRKAVYERMHPETKRGGDRGNQHTGGRQTDTMSFCQSTAEKFGISERQARRLVQAGVALSQEDTARLRGAPLPVTLKDLTEIAKIGEPDERSRVVQLLSQGTSKNASDARRQYLAEKGDAPSPLNPTDQAFSRLLDAWDRAPKAARDIFLEKRGEEVHRILTTGADAAEFQTFASSRTGGDE